MGAALCQRQRGRDEAGRARETTQVHFFDGIARLHRGVEGRQGLRRGLHSAGFFLDFFKSSEIYKLYPNGNL